ncbi:unnamed protein product [Closterium sp. Naga37s-1]|nr:unnamed protein product [Closterium sp. Naga37s-1]
MVPSPTITQSARTPSLLPIPFSSFPHPSFPHPIIPSASVCHPSIPRAYFHHSTIRSYPIPRPPCHLHPVPSPPCFFPSFAKKFVFHHLLYLSPTHPLLSPSILSPSILSLSLLSPSLLFQTHNFLIPSSPRPFPPCLPSAVPHLPLFLASSILISSLPPILLLTFLPSLSSSPPFCFSPPRPPYLPSSHHHFLPLFLHSSLLPFLRSSLPHLPVVIVCSASCCDVLAV